MVGRTVRRLRTDARRTARWPAHRGHHLAGGHLGRVRGMSFLGDALAHGVLPGIAIAFIIGVDTSIGALVAAGAMVGGIAVIRRHSPLPGRHLDRRAVRRIPCACGRDHVDAARVLHGRPEPLPVRLDHRPRQLRRDPSGHRCRDRLGGRRRAVSSVSRHDVRRVPRLDARAPARPRAGGTARLAGDLDRVVVPVGREPPRVRVS